MDEHKPCPFCGSDDIGFVLLWPGIEAHSARCKQCGSTGGERYTKNEAITAWNTRAPSQAESEVRDELQRVRKWFLSICNRPDCGCDHGSYAKEIEAILAKYPKGGEGEG